MVRFDKIERLKSVKDYRNFCWLARLLRHVNSSDCTCQSCRPKFIAWKKETSVDFIHLMNHEKEKIEGGF